jgi:hypothetical protein
MMSLCSTVTRLSLLLGASLLSLASTDALAQRRAPLTFPSDTPVAVHLKLLPQTASSGLIQPVFNNFMAQVQFSGEADVTTCALRLYDPDAQLVAGQELDLALRCVAPFKVAPGQPEMQLFAHGRPIGQARLRSRPLAEVMGEEPVPGGPAASQAR